MSTLGRMKVVAFGSWAYQRGQGHRQRTKRRVGGGSTVEAEGPDRLGGVMICKIEYVSNKRRRRRRTKGDKATGRANKD